MDGAYLLRQCISWNEVRRVPASRVSCGCSTDLITNWSNFFHAAVLLLPCRSVYTLKLYTCAQVLTILRLFWLIERMLRSLCDIQLYAIPSQLSLLRIWIRRNPCRKKVAFDRASERDYDYRTQNLISELRLVILIYQFQASPTSISILLLSSVDYGQGVDCPM